MMSRHLSLTMSKIKFKILQGTADSIVEACPEFCRTGENCLATLGARCSQKQAETPHVSSPREGPFFFSGLALCLSLAGYRLLSAPISRHSEDYQHEVVLAVDHGSVLCSANGEITSRFQWRNNTERVWDLDRYVVSNGCCVGIRLDKGSVKPGETLEATMTLREGNRTGDHRWFAVVWPSELQQPTLQFAASAVLVPRATLVVEKMSAEVEVGHVGHGKGYIVYRSPSPERPVDPIITVSGAASFTTTDARHVKEGGWAKTTIPFTLEMAASVRPGAQNEIIRVQSPDGSFKYDHQLSWRSRHNGGT